MSQADTLQAVNRLEVGVGFGIMEYGVDFTPSTMDEPFRGINFGLTFRYFDHKLVGLQAELSYVQAGWREDFGEDFTTLYERQTNYLELMILTQFSIGKGALQPMFQAGPYLSVPLSEEEIIPEGFVRPDSSPQSRYDFDLPFRLNYGLQAGLGFNLELGSITIQADGRYLVGFNDLIKTGDTTAAISRRTGFGGHVAVFYAIFDR